MRTSQEEEEERGVLGEAEVVDVAATESASKTPWKVTIPRMEYLDDSFLDPNS
jgi:hypothetical protein